MSIDWTLCGKIGGGVVAVAAVVAGLGACAFSRAGVEQPEYGVEDRLGEVELRRYPAMVVVEVPMDGRGEETGRPFRRLFRYISGDKIAMTAPVLMGRGEAEGEGARMAFILPAEVAAGGAPGAEEEGVELREMAAGLYAARRFRGERSVAAEQAALAEIEGALEGSGWRAVGPVMGAYYDPPWTPVGLRRNEALVEVERADGGDD